MNFNSSIKSISIGSHAKTVFEELETIRPKHVSFSLMLAISADFYIKNHKKGLIKLDDFTCNEVSARVPTIFSDITSWVNYISKSDDNSFKDLQDRLTQIQNIVDKRNGNSIY